LFRTLYHTFNIFEGFKTQVAPEAGFGYADVKKSGSSSDAGGTVNAPRSVIHFCL